MNSLTLAGSQAAVSAPPKIPKTSQMQVYNQKSGKCEEIVKTSNLPHNRQRFQ